MTKQSIRSREIKNNFIKKACQIIENEGTANLTVRKLSQVTGYHYAAIYHYFKNLEHLIAHAAIIFHEELYQSIEKDSRDFSDLIDIYKNGIIGMAKYGFKKPRAFMCVFVDSFGNINRNEVVEVVSDSKLLINKELLIDKIISVYKIGKQKMIDFDKSATALVVGYVILLNSLRFNGTIKDALKNLAIALDSLWYGTIHSKTKNK